MTRFAGCRWPQSEEVGDATTEKRKSQQRKKVGNPEKKENTRNSGIIGMALPRQKTYIYREKRNAPHRTTNCSNGSASNLGQKKVKVG